MSYYRSPSSLKNLGTHDKAFHPTSEDLQPHALGGEFYRHILALQPKSHMSVNQGLIKP